VTGWGGGDYRPASLPEGWLDKAPVTDPSVDGLGQSRKYNPIHVVAVFGSIEHYEEWAEVSETDGLIGRSALERAITAHLEDIPREEPCCSIGAYVNEFGEE